MSHDIGRMAMRDFAEAMARDAWLLLPVGATEEHGPHLPLASGTIQAEYVCRAVENEMDTIVALSIGYEICRTTRNFPGTISLSSRTFETLTLEIPAGYVENGAHRMPVISGHTGGPRMQALRQAALSLAEQDAGLTILVIGPSDISLPSLSEAGTAAWVGHAASLETSVMLAIDPDLVLADRIPEAEWPRLPRFHILPHPERLFPSGVMGDASQATRAQGENALRHVTCVSLRILQEATPLVPAKEGGC